VHPVYQLSAIKKNITAKMHKISKLHVAATGSSMFVINGGSFITSESLSKYSNNDIVIYCKITKDYMNYIKILHTTHT